MNKIQKIACLIGMMVLLNANALAQGQGSYGGMAEDIILGVLMLAFAYFIVVSILIPYVGMRLACWVYGIVLFIGKRKWDKWNVLLILLDIPMFFCAFYLFNEYYIKPKEKERIYEQSIQANIFNAEPGSEVILKQAKDIAHITMPKGTEIRLEDNLAAELPQYKKISSVKFPKPVIWNNIPIVAMWFDSYYLDNMGIWIQSESQIMVGKWICKGRKDGKDGQKYNSYDIIWKPLPEKMATLNDDNLEESVYLHSCELAGGQTVFLPDFKAVLPISDEKDLLQQRDLLQRKQDTFRDIAQGLWYINISSYDSKLAMGIRSYGFHIMADSEKVVHHLFFKVQETSVERISCNLPPNTLVGWSRSQPDTVLVTNLPLPHPKLNQNHQQVCWGKTLHKVSIDEMQKALPQYDIKKIIE